MQSKKNHLIADAQLWESVFWYVAWALFALVVLTYLLFQLKIFMQNHIKESQDAIVASYAASDRASYQKKALGYEQQLTTFSKALNNHTTTAKVFNFLEAATLPNIWFSNFELSQEQNTMHLSGQANSMQTLGGQLAVFQQHSEAVRSAQIVASQVTPDGNVNFTLTVSLNPRIFYP